MKSLINKMNMRDIYDDCLYLDISPSQARILIKEFNGNHPFRDPDDFNTTYYPMNIKNIKDTLICLIHKRGESRCYRIAVEDFGGCTADLAEELLYDALEKLETPLNHPHPFH